MIFSSLIHAGESELKDVRQEINVDNSLTDRYLSNLVRLSRYYAKQGLWVVLVRLAIFCLLAV